VAAAEALRHEAEALLARERAWWPQRVGETYALGDALFDWALRENHPSHPPLVGRARRLERLEKTFSQFVEDHRDHPGLQDEVRRARFQLAEIALARGDATAADALLARALEAGSVGKEGPVEPRRLARFRVVQFSLVAEQAELAAARAILTRARRAVAELDPDSPETRFFMASLDFHESQLRTRAGEETAALASLQRAAAQLNALADAHPDVAFLRSEMAECHLRASELLDRRGEVARAEKLRRQAAEQLVELLEQAPEDLDLRLALAGCYGAMAEAAVLAGKIGKAESMSGAALKLLGQILPHRPASAAVRVRLAAQKGLMAGLQRDRGRGESALALYDEALGTLEEMMGQEEPDPRVRYRYALLIWQRGRMLGFNDQPEGELRAEQRAVELLRALRETRFGEMHREALERSLGYLLGDLGHALQRQDRPQEAAEVFRQAVAVWQQRVRQRPGHEESLEALRWNRQRLEAIE
jgi:tetratricopeptide (TPR) repeat protein